MYPRLGTPGVNHRIIPGGCNKGHFLCGVERVKRFVNIHLHHQKPKKDRQNVDVGPLPGKFLWTPMSDICCVGRI